MAEREADYDAVVVGAGATGTAAALALAREGFRTALVGPVDLARNGRTVALLDGSVRFLRALGAWEAIEPGAAAMVALRIVDDTGSLFRPPPVRFDAAEIGLEAFGWNTENATLVEALLGCAAREPNLTHRREAAAAVDRAGADATVTLADGRILRAPLLVGADGARSAVRAALGIGAREWRYPQVALTTLLEHDRPHGGVSTEFHTRSGPFTLVPLPGGRRSSLVWVAAPERAEALHGLDDAALGRAAETACRAMLGRMTATGRRGLVPMRGLSARALTGPGTVLIGEAAHVFPPIGAQGLNLGLRDAASLRDHAILARSDGGRPGGADMLAAFARGRRVDTAVRTMAVDGLNRSLLADLLAVDLVRGLGLVALGAVPALRRAVMRRGVLPSVGAPLLMR